MAFTAFDVQTALLYPELPRVDLEGAIAFLDERLREEGLQGQFSRLNGLCGNGQLCLAGYGMHLTVTVHDEPLKPEAFEMALKAPILKTKKFDFHAAIAQHKAGIVITVGDGEVPMPADVRHTMQDAGVMEMADPEHKLMALHILLQAIAVQSPPLLIDFCPSQTLLTYQELACVNGFAFPVPILFHPFPFRKGTDEEGRPRQCIEAIHAQMLIGASLELEAIPYDMDLATIMNYLSTYIIEKRAGNMPLAHGDQLDSGDGRVQYVRHEATNDGGTKIIISFDTEAPEGSVQPKASQQSEGQAAFNQRVARLKAKAPNAAEIPQGVASIPDPTPQLGAYAEGADELRSRVRDTIGMGSESAARSSMMKGPMKLIGAFTLMGLMFAFLGETETTSSSLVTEKRSTSSLPQTGLSTEANQQTTSAVAAGVSIVKTLEGTMNR